MTTDKGGTPPPAQPPAEQPPAEPALQGADGQTNLPSLAKAEEILKKLEEKETTLGEREKALDAKIKAFDKAMAEAKLGGMGRYTPEQTAEEKVTEGANKLLEQSGFQVASDPYDAFSGKRRK